MNQIPTLRYLEYLYSYTTVECVLEGADMTPDQSRLGEQARVPSPPHIGLQYLAEGAANVVYRILPNSASDTLPSLHGQLLRLRKNTPSTVPCAQTVSNFNARIAPLFPPAYLIQPTLFALPQGVIYELNQKLRECEETDRRPKKRRGVFLTSQAEEPHGILVNDMTPKHEDEKFYEFKPKWLVQSPSAPTDASRCRNCALKAMRRSLDVVAGRGDADFCPMNLLSSDNGSLRHIVESIGVDEKDAVGFVEVWKLHIRPLLSRLRELQGQYNNVGLGDFEEGEQVDPSISMTLRDCSVFIKIVKHAEDAMDVEVRLADLDLKTSAGGKLRKWADTERQLITGGWYIASREDERRGINLCRALIPS